MQFSVDFPRFFKGIHAIFCGFSQVFQPNPCNFRWIFPGFFFLKSVHFLWIFPGFCRESIGCSQVFLGSPCTFSVDFPRIFKESMQFSVDFQVFLGNPCNFLWDFPRLLWGIHALSVDSGFFGIHALFVGIHALSVDSGFLGNPCIVCGFSQGFLHFLWIFPGFL